MKKVSGFVYFDRMMNVINRISSKDKTNVSNKFITDGRYKLYMKYRQKKYLSLAKKRKLYLLGKSENFLELSKEELKAFHTKFSSDFKEFLPTCLTKMTDTETICPFCERQFPSFVTTEHILPQRDAAEFIILPPNMILACHDCNTFLHSRMGMNNTDTEINLYFESYDITRNIEINFVTDRNATQELLIYKPVVTFASNLYSNPVLQNRLFRFWKNYQLGNTYSKEAHKIFVAILIRLVVKLKNKGTQAVDRQKLTAYLEEINKEAKECNRVAERIANFYWEFRISDFFLKNTVEFDNLCEVLNGKLNS